MYKHFFQQKRSQVSTFLPTKNIQSIKLQFSPKYQRCQRLHIKCSFKLGCALEQSTENSAAKYCAQCIVHLCVHCSVHCALVCAVVQQNNMSNFSDLKYFPIASQITNRKDHIHETNEKQREGEEKEKK